MKHKNLKYVSSEDYDKIKERYAKEGYILIEINGNKVQNEEDLYDVFRKKINAPDHFYYNLHAFSDLLYDFFDLNNSRKMIILIKDISKIKNKEFLGNILTFFNNASEYWKTHKEANFVVYIFESNKEITF